MYVNITTFLLVCFLIKCKTCDEFHTSKLIREKHIFFIRIKKETTISEVKQVHLTTLRGAVNQEFRLPNTHPVLSWLGW